MKITDLYREKMADILGELYKGLIPRENFLKLIDAIIEKKKKNFPVLKLRNLYKFTEFKVPLNDILEVIEKEHLCCGANGTLTYDYNTKESKITKELINIKKERRIFTDKAIEAESKNDFATANFYNNLSNYKKTLMNSFYGIQLQRGSFLYNPDTATMITTQARELISEMMWSIERFIMSNFQFATFDEIFLFIDYCIKDSVNIKSVREYITYVPTFKDVYRRFLYLSSTVEGCKNYLLKTSKFTFNLLKKMTDDERITFFYKSNFFELIRLNPKVRLLIDSIVEKDVEFMEPMKIPEAIKFEMETLKVLADTLIYSKMTTYDRVEKYVNRDRFTVILSDTDSVIINLNPFIEFYCSLHKDKVAEIKKEQNVFKLVNVMSNLCTHLTRVMGDLYCKQCNVPKEMWQHINMKNEFYFKRLILYSDVAKNYAVYQRLREGTLTDKISYTGLKLSGSTKNKIVQEYIQDIIENKILKSETIDSISIYKDVVNLEKLLYNRLEEGDYTLGLLNRFSGEGGYKNAMTVAQGRAAIVWNKLYPDDPINIDDYGYVFSTSLLTLEDCKEIEKVDKEIYKRIEIEIFGDPRLSKYGLSKIMIPKSGSTSKIPKWLLPYIDKDMIVRRHMQPIISLLPSIGIYKSKLSSTEFNYSSVIKF